MKITLITTHAPPLVGGLEKVCLRLAQHLGAAGHEVGIVARFTRHWHPLRECFSDSEDARSFEQEGVPTTVLPLTPLSRLWLRPAFRWMGQPRTLPLARWCYRTALGRPLAAACRGSDVLHYLGGGPELLGFAAEEVARKMGARFLVEPALHSGLWGDSWVDRELYLRADGLLAHTNHEAAVLKQMGVTEERVSVVTHGVDLCTSGIGRRFRERHGIDGPMVLFLGRKSGVKGVERLIEAWPGIRERHASARLVLMGHRQKKAAYEVPASALDLDDVAEPDKQDALAACDVLCVPSKGESFGMVYFEAWAYEKPVVALNLPVLVETIQAAGGGLLVDPNPPAIGAAIDELLASPERRREMGRRGAELAARHDWPKAAATYLEAYKTAGC